MKIPRDCNAPQLIKALRKLGYIAIRQDGSHIRIKTQMDGVHHVTIPNHRPIKIGTLHNILKAIASHHRITMDQLMSDLEL